MKLDNFRSVGRRDSDGFIGALRINDEDFACRLQRFQTPGKIMGLVADGDDHGQGQYRRAFP